MDRSPRRARWPLAAAVPLTAAASLVLVLAATARANLDGRTGDGSAAPVAAGNGVDLEVPAMLPGRSVSTCALVPGVASEPESLRIVATATGDLAPHLDLVVRRGSPGATCADPGPTVPVHAGSLADAGESAGSHLVVEVAERADRAPYVFEVSLPADTPNDAQGADATVGLRWEVRPVGARR